MELLRDADPVIRELLPAVFDEAGMSAYASCLRSAPRLTSLDAALVVCSILKEARLRAGDARPHEWRETVAESAFFAEGAILAATEGDIDLFSDCLKMLRRTVAEGWARFAVH